jgi:hypothetical protein
MADRFDALVVREYQDRQSGENKSRWTKIGVAFVSEKDGSIKVMLDANPFDGVIHLRKPRAQEDGGQRLGGRQRGQSGGYHEEEPPPF